MKAVAGRKVVVTGEVPGHSRGTAQAFLQDAGAYVQSSMSAATEVLVVGAKPGPKKLEKAAQLGITVITWEEMLAGNGGGDDCEFRRDDEREWYCTTHGVTMIGPEPVHCSAQHGELTTERVHEFLQLTAVRSVSPQLALKATELPEGDEWLFEVKWDGYRCVATVKDGQVAMQSRSGRSEYAAQFPKIAVALAGLPDCVLDGELIVMGEGGVTSFETAHQAATGMEAFVIFDALEVEGEDVRNEPLWQRREGIKVLIGDEGMEFLRVSPAHDDGAWLLAWASEMGLEGVVAKRKDSRYVEGSRTSDWLKIKLRNEQEFVVLGWVPGEGNRAGAAGSLLLGVNVAGEGLPPIWKSCGRVGTGGDLNVWREFVNLPPASPGIDYDLSTATRADTKDIVWVEPAIIVQVKFQRWTKDDHLWHPSLIGVRGDKSPLDVRRES